MHHEIEVENVTYEIIKRWTGDKGEDKNGHKEEPKEPVRNAKE